MPLYNRGPPGYADKEGRGGGGGGGWFGGFMRRYTKTPTHGTAVHKHNKHTLGVGLHDKTRVDTDAWNGTAAHKHNKHTNTPLGL